MTSQMIEASTRANGSGLCAHSNAAKHMKGSCCEV